MIAEFKQYISTKRIATNVRPGRLLPVLIVRRAANWLRSTAYFSLRCRFARRHGFVRIPWSVSIWAPNGNVELGDCVQFGARCRIQCDIRIGNQVLIAGEVAFVGRNDHCTSKIGTTIWDSPRGVDQPTVVEDDVWIGYRATILSGVRIGKGAVVAAGAVVVKDIEPYTVVAGVPATVVKRRFTAEEITRHEAILAAKSL